MITLFIPAFGVLGFGMLQFVSEKKFKIYAVLFCAVLSIHALFFYPTSNLDAYRYFANMDWMRGFSSLSEYVSGPGFNFGRDLFSNILLFLISRTGMYTILTFISYFISILCITLPITKIYWKNINNKSSQMFTIFCFIVLLCIGNHTFYLSAVRFFIASAIFVLLVFYDQGKDLSRYHILFLIPLFFHQGSIFLIGLYFLPKLFKYINPLKLAVTAVIVFIFSRFLMSDSNLNFLISKAYTYFSPTGALGYVRTKTVALEVSFIVTFLIFIVISRKLVVRETNQSNLPSRITFLTTGTLFLIPFNDMFNRYSCIVVVLVIFCYALYFGNLNRNEKIIVFINFILLIVVGIYINTDFFYIVHDPNLFEIYTTNFFESVKLIPIFY